MNVNGKLSKKFEGLFLYTKAPLNDSFRGACLFFSEVTLLYYLVKLKALRIAGNKLVVDSFAQSFKTGMWFSP